VQEKSSSFEDQFNDELDVIFMGHEINVPEQSPSIEEICDGTDVSPEHLEKISEVQNEDIPDINDHHRSNIVSCNPYKYQPTIDVSSENYEVSSENDPEDEELEESLQETDLNAMIDVNTDVTLSITDEAIKKKTKKRTALVIIDVQEEYINPKGLVFHPTGEQLVKGINKFRSMTEKYWELVVLTMDWHPENWPGFHNTKAENPIGLLLSPITSAGDEAKPKYCLRNTWGGKISNLLFRDADDYVLRKATRECALGYSAFQDHDNQSTGLLKILRNRGVTHVYICGLKYSRCAKHTALDAQNFGFNPFYHRSDPSRGQEDNSKCQQCYGNRWN